MYTFSHYFIYIYILYITNFMSQNKAKAHNRRKPITRHRSHPLDASLVHGLQTYRGTASYNLPVDSTSLSYVAASPYWAGSLWYDMGMYREAGSRQFIQYAKLARTGALCNLPSVH